MRKYLFLEDGPMSQGTQTLTTDEAQEIRDAIVGRQVCPFCGAVMEQQEGACPRCTMENTSASRQATKSRIGPWYVLQTRNPAAPGMKFETLLGFVRKGRVKPKSVVRGPTTHQLWRFAAHVKGLSREFGVCYSCGGAVEHAAALCPHCNRSQDPPLNPNSFLEGLDQPALPGAKLPLYRELEAPMVAEDMAAPAMQPAHTQTQADAEAHGGPDPKSIRKNTDGFLTAQDLAAAFKLDFQPKGRRAQQQPQKLQPVRPKSRRKRHVGRYLFLLVLLGGSGTAAYELYQDPALRDRVFTQASEWYHQASAWAQQKWTELRQPRPAKSASVSHDSAPSVLAVEPVSKPARIEQAPLPTVQPSAPPAVQPASMPGKTDAWDQFYQQPSSAAPGSSSTQADQSSARHYRQGSRDDVWALYTSAIDAEAQGDYRTAVHKYEQIKEFSPDLRPRDLELRLKEARQQVQ